MKSDEEREPLPKITIKMAMNALAVLHQFEKQADDRSGDWITSLNKHERVLQGRRLRALTE
jgi:hypothetical protein